jgi:uncharacterized protein YkwD
MNRIILMVMAIGICGCVSTDSPSVNSSVNDTSVSPTPTASSPSGPVTLDSEESAFVVLINNYRLQSGLTALQLSPLLTTASKWMSTNMANNNYFSHTDSLGRDPFTRMAFFGYDISGYCGENIAAGSATAADTFTQWQNSPAHNANMLDANYVTLGVGRASNPSSTYDWYWTTDFGSVLNE